MLADILNSMHTKFIYTCAIIFVAVMLIFSSCRKDDNQASTTNTKTDSTAINSFLANPGNYLASSGTLVLRVNGTVLSFDASTDSIALINLTTPGKQQYYGLSAINKAHTASFGITSAGVLHVRGESGVAGSQLLILASDKQPVSAYSLSATNPKNSLGSLNFDTFTKDSLATKGSFVTYLTQNSNQATGTYTVEGSFNLRFK